VSTALATLAVAALPAFVAAVVEWVEAFTIVLAVGNTRGWRSPLWGVFAGLLSLGVIVVLFGTPLIVYQDQVTQTFHLLIGILLLLFGMRWLRKSILRFAGIIAEHDEDHIYQREVADLRDQTRDATHPRWDNVGFWLSYKAVLVEGLEVAFIVLALGATGGSALQAAIAGAVAAFVVVVAAGAMLHKPLSFVPENFMKFVVGCMLTTFGVFWSAEGMLVEWPGGDAMLPLLLLAVVLTSLVGVRVLQAMSPRHASESPAR